MDEVFVRPDFADTATYRLVSVDKTWAEALRRRTCVQRVGSAKRARHEEDADGTSSVVLVMKGSDQLYASDERETFLVRRVEYSNTLLVSERWPTSVTGAGEAQTVSLPGDSPSCLRRRARSVVVAELSRLFETHKCSSRNSVVNRLQDTVLTLEELTQHRPPASSLSAALYTFQDLARMSCSSPTELAAALKRKGAVVHRNYVRLLDPSALYRALRAVLSYLDTAEMADADWEAVVRHFCPAVFPAVVIGVVRAVYGCDAATEDKIANAVDDDPEDCAIARLLDVRKVITGLAGSAFDGGRASQLTPTPEGAEETNAVQMNELPHGIRAPSLPFDEFALRWRSSFPLSFFGRFGVPLQGATAAEFVQLLTGHVIVKRPHERNYLGATAWWLPCDTLPSDLRVRLDILFAVDAGRWQGSVLEPYITPLLGAEQTFGHVMPRYTREYRTPGEPVSYAPLSG